MTININELLNRLEAAESEAIEQARLNGMGAERELALMAKLEAAEKERDALSAELSKQQTLTVAAQHVAEVAQRRANQLQAKITEMERQKPVGKFVQHPSNGLWEQDGYGDNPEAIPLYALPGAKGEEK